MPASPANLIPSKYVISLHVFPIGASNLRCLPSVAAKCNGSHRTAKAFRRTLSRVGKPVTFIFEGSYV